LQEISNNIAQAVIEDIIGLNEEGDTDDWRIPELSVIITSDVAEAVGFNGGARPLVAWGGTAFADTKLGLETWLDQAIQSGEDLRIFYRAAAAAAAAA
jgi:hypothetical protein